MKLAPKIALGTVLALAAVLSLGGIAHRTFGPYTAWILSSLLVIAATVATVLHLGQLEGSAAHSGRCGGKWVGIAVRYLSALILVPAALVLHRWLSESFGPLPIFVTLYPAVLLVVSIAGGGPGVLATAVAALAADYWIMAPHGFGIAAANDVVAVVIFVSVNLFLSILAERFRRSRWAEAISVARENAARQQAEALSLQNEELARQTEELMQQGEELSQQAEEMTQQSEEIAQQNEELQSQSEEIRTLNAELHQREDILQKMLDSARVTAAEQTVLQDLCDSAREMFGQACDAAAMFEVESQQVFLRAHSGLDLPIATTASHPLKNTFAELVVREGKTAALEDASLRSDLSLAHLGYDQSFQAILASPLRIGKRTNGVLAIYSRRKQPWTTAQFRLVEWVAAQCANIIETLRLQQSVRESEVRYRTLFNGMTEGFSLHEILCDEEGQPCDYRFLDVNQAFEQLTGLKRSDVVGHTFKEILPEEDSRWLAIYGAVAISGEPAQFENYSPVLKRHYQVFAYRPALHQFATIFLDITERKLAEESLRRAADDLARSNKDLEQFAYVASHDLKEPLRMVTGFTSLLQDRCQGKLDAKADEYIAFASEAATRMQTLIDDLLAYSRVGRSAADEQADLGAILAQSLRSLSISVAESAAQITHDALPTVQSNAREWGQVFQNLIGNAIKVRGDRSPQIHVGAQRNTDHWLLTVRDNGIGIDPQFADRIFMIFQRLHAREEYPGTGIGLAICKKIVERHGGRIWVESQPGDGSTFHFTIPDKQTIS